jgi:hypothetical protein
MPAAAILRRALVSRCTIAASETTKALAISAVVSPQTVRRVSATRASGDSEGWQQVNTRRSRPSSTSGSPGGSTGQAASASFWR